MQSKNFFENTKDEVKKMNPETMVKTLEKFGFDKKSVNTSGTLLIEFENVSEWLAKLSKKGVTDTELGNIRGNDALNLYLKAIVDRVNANPAILNKHLFKNANPNDYNKIIGLRTTGMPIGIAVRKVGNTAFDVAALRREIDMYKNDISSLKSVAESRYFIQNGQLFMFGAPYIRRAMIGGGVAVVDNSTLFSGSIKPRKHAELLDVLKSNIINKLKSMGKNLKSADEQALDQLIVQYKAVENKLMTAIGYVEEYVKIASVLNDPNVDIDIDEMKKFVDARSKYFTKTINAQANILDAFEYMLKEAVEKADA